MQFSAALVSTLLLASNAAAQLGINCRGSGLCTGGNVASGLRDLIRGSTDTDRTYKNGENIACLGNTCAFLQNAPNGAKIALIQQLAQAIVEHGCKNCGSAPFKNNNVNTGELTFNFVAHPGCTNRLC